MAGLRICRNAGGAPTNDNSTPKPTPAVSYALIPAPAETSAPAQAPALTSAPASIPGPPERYTNEDLQNATKLTLELFVKGQEYGQLQANSASRKQPLKARFPNLYYRNSHLDCYRFCQQCEDYFKTAGANKLNRFLFATLFFCRAMI